MTPGMPGPPLRGVLLVASIDTEEDNWNRSRRDVTVENIAELRRLSAFLGRLGVRPTFFTTHQVACDRRAADVLCEVRASSGGEIAAHLHPWNTPPFAEACVPRNSMLCNLPAALQLAKLQRLTAALEEAFAFTPAAFRAGRYGLGRGTVAALAQCGYRVDSSVTPFVSWAEVDDGPSFVGAPLGVYRLGADRDVTLPSPDGEVLELPLSCGFSRGPVALWGMAHRVLAARPVRRARLAGLVARARLIKRVVLSPEVASVADMLALSGRLLEYGVRHLHVSWHSPSLKAGLSPFAGSAADVARLYASVERYLDGLARLTPFTPVTVSEAAALLG